MNTNLGKFFTTPNSGLLGPTRSPLGITLKLMESNRIARHVYEGSRRAESEGQATEKVDELWLDYLIIFNL